MPSVPLVIAVLGCTSEEPGDRRGRRAKAPEGPVWSDVAPLFADRCGGCHLPGGIGPLPLSTWSEVFAARDAVRYAVEERRMPPWPAAPADYAFQADPSLTDEEIALVAEWVEADAPLGDADPDEVLEPPAPERALPRVDAVLTPLEAYQPSPELTDDYRCLVLDPSGPVEGYVAGLRFVIDNRSAIHHAKLISVAEGGLDLEEQLALDPEPGFACSDEFEVAFGDAADLVGMWLPGVEEARLFPEGSGVAVQPGASWVLVVHYHPPGSDGLPDRTSVELWLEPEVEQPIDLMFGTNYAWRHAPEEGGLVIPAGDAEVHHVWRTPVWALQLEGIDEDEAGVDLVAAMVHMHRLGASGTVELLVAGESHTLLDIPDWSLDWQLDYWPVEPIRLGPDDEIRLDCVHDNALGDRDVPWGEATDDEMCGVMLSLRQAAP